MVERDRVLSADAPCSESNVFKYGATGVATIRQDRVLPRSLTGAVSASTIMYPVRPFVFLLYADLALVAWRIKQKTLVSFDPGSR